MPRRDLPTDIAIGVGAEALVVIAIVAAIIFDVDKVARILSGIFG